MNSIILIPARFASTRYPGKPLVELKGAGGTAKPLIQRSVEAASRVPGVSGVFVVTDDERIADDETQDPRSLSASFLAQNLTGVEPDELHEIRRPDRSQDGFFQSLD